MLDGKNIKKKDIIKVFFGNVTQLYFSVLVIFDLQKAFIIGSEFGCWLFEAENVIPKRFYKMCGTAIKLIKYYNTKILCCKHKNFVQNYCLNCKERRFNLLFEGDRMNFINFLKFRYLLFIYFVILFS